MAEESEVQKLKSKYPEFFGQFPPEFLEFVFSEETSLEIAGICLENGIEDEKIIDKITSQITLVLFNEVPKENLVKIFEREMELNRMVAEKISFDLERRIFSQVPEYQTTNSPSSVKPRITPPPERPPEVKAEKIKKDVYREKIE